MMVGVLLDCTLYTAARCLVYMILSDLARYRVQGVNETRWDIVPPSNFDRIKIKRLRNAIRRHYVIEPVIQPKVKSERRKDISHNTKALDINCARFATRMSPSYNHMPNVINVISNPQNDCILNAMIWKKGKMCNCRNRGICPTSSSCRENVIIYQAQVSTRGFW